MVPVIPTGRHEKAELVEFQAPVKGMKPLPAFMDTDGLVLTEWKPTPEEAMAIASGANVRVWVITGNKKMQPLSVNISDVPQAN